VGEIVQKKKILIWTLGDSRMRMSNSEKEELFREEGRGQ
jgi:hypothetical protein